MEPQLEKDLHKGEFIHNIHDENIGSNEGIE